MNGLDDDNDAVGNNRNGGSDRTCTMPPPPPPPHPAKKHMSSSDGHGNHGFEVPAVLPTPDDFFERIIPWPAKSDQNDNEGTPEEEAKKVDMNLDRDEEQPYNADEEENSNNITVPIGTNVIPENQPNELNRTFDDGESDNSDNAGPDSGLDTSNNINTSNNTITTTANETSEEDGDPSCVDYSEYEIPTTQFSDIIGHGTVKLRLDELLLPLALPLSVSSSILRGEPYSIVFPVEPTAAVTTFLLSKHE